jgi:hypothetical protein
MLVTAGLVASVAPWHVQAQASAPAAPATIDGTLQGAEKLGEGVVGAWRKNGSTLLLLPAAVFERPFLWYAEVVSVPSQVIGQLDLGSSVVQFERQGPLVFVRDLTSTYDKRAGAQDPAPGLETPRARPIDYAVRRGTEAPIVAVLPVLAATADGSALVDATRVFAGDVEHLSAAGQVTGMGLLPAAVDPLRTYITSVRVFPRNFGVRTHLTFLTKDPKQPALPPRAVSMRIGHSLVMLPDRPMAARAFDRRVGFFASTYTEFESGPDRATAPRSQILRFRLEKKDPGAAVSDPVKPIVFHIGREVPDRWRPAIKAAGALWEPVFRAAGFSNAIRVVDAPTPEQDPSWTEEDVRYSVVRWLAQPRANARGPSVSDPRSGEILSSHVEVWPAVLDVFSRYYFAVASPLDPKARTLPLPEEVQAQILTYALAHEIGHAIGLRHNHMASTAYTVAQLRNPEFANRFGANASIMAYGRFNQAAQPGDGVTRFIPGVGPYDYFAILWGYGVHGSTPQQEQQALAQLAARTQTDRTLLWGAAEYPDELERWGDDPRHKRENTGAERVLSTRLGIANLHRSLQNLDAATTGRPDAYTSGFESIRGQNVTWLVSVADLVAGIETRLVGPDGVRAAVVPAAPQREAVQYLLGEGAASLAVYADPALGTRMHPTGSQASAEGLQANVVAALLQPRKLKLLELQKSADPAAYGLADMMADAQAAVWADLSTAPRWRRALQRAWLERLAVLLNTPTANAEQREATFRLLPVLGVSRNFGELDLVTAADTLLPAWAQDALPALAGRLDQAAAAAARDDDRLHFRQMALMARRAVPLPLVARP